MTRCISYSKFKIISSKHFMAVTKPQVSGNRSHGAWQLPRSQVFLAAAGTVTKKCPVASATIRPVLSHNTPPASNHRPKTINFLTSKQPLYTSSTSSAPLRISSTNSAGLSKSTMREIVSINVPTDEFSTRLSALPRVSLSEGLLTP